MENQPTVSNYPHSTSNSVNNGGTPTAAAAAAPSPKSTPRFMDANPSGAAATFIHADTSSFKQVVQMLTGSAETTAKHAKNTKPAAKAPAGPKKPTFKLYERRGSLKSLKMIGPLIPTLLGSSPPRKQQQLPEILSPSVLDFPSLALSPVTPLIPDPFNRSQQQNSDPAVTAEDRAIAERGFYLHPSPRTTAREAEPPRLLPLFPVTSPRMSSASAAGSSA
ncbi:VQ motif-containing protein 4-like [Canna indica]|uniref:VQ motif-containing protein 4-like n=1 Tax=Canna indica TaxID=4628 RepID=A0AAQ3L0S6_9LILI|nr:VQ motif-containing protein 4-like [Canna indica]